MEHRRRHRILSLAVAAGVGLVLGPGAQAQARPDSLPPGVTPAMVNSGRQLFGGLGLCLACHGPEGKGGIGPDLTDGKWDHINGSYEQLVARIIKGVGTDESKTGQIMPPRGGGALTDDQVKAVAAYVWTISHRAPARP